LSVPAAVVAAMRATNERFSRAVAARDIAAFDAIYTSDALILPPGAQPIQGREPIKAFWQSALVGMDVKAAVLEAVDAELLGPHVFEIGRGVLTVGAGQQVAVKYVVQWRQEDSLWKWHVDIWNPNQ